jgi:starch phosphorylase
MWGGYKNICEIIAITNAQNKTYWQDPQLEKALQADDENGMIHRKKEMKRKLFRVVANQTGKTIR